jgi:hypothetical protein
MIRRAAIRILQAWQITNTTTMTAHEARLKAFPEFNSISTEDMQRRIAEAVQMGRASLRMSNISLTRDQEKGLLEAGYSVGMLTAQTGSPTQGDYPLATEVSWV